MAVSVDFQKYTADTYTYTRAHTGAFTDRCESLLYRVFIFVFLTQHLKCMRRAFANVQRGNGNFFLAAEHDKISIFTIVENDRLLDAAVVVVIIVVTGQQGYGRIRIHYRS